MLSKYIKSLLELHNRVIVPDLGAFMLKPESQDIYFNEFLRFNDGLLVDYVAEKEHIEKLEAVKKVKTYVDDINNQLSTARTVNLEGIGTLFMDVNEKIQLKNPQKAGHANDIPKAEPVEQQPVSEPKPIFSASEEKRETVVTKNTPRPEQPKQPSSVKPQQIKNMKKPAPMQPKNAELTDIVPTNTRNMIIVGIVGLIVIAGIIYFAFIKDEPNNLNQNIFSNNIADSSVVTKDSAKVPNETTRVTSGNKPVVRKPVYTSPTHSKKYHLISGAFIIESNADRMVKKMAGEGFQVEKLLDAKNSMYYVSIATFDSKSSASQEMRRLKETSNTITWLYTR